MVTPEDGLLGYFNPALPYSADELRGMGFDTAGGRFTVPAPDDRMLGELFGEEIGMNVLPGNLPIEIEAIFELYE